MDKFDVIVFTSGPKAYAPLRLKKECELIGLSFLTIRYKDIEIHFKSGKTDLVWNGQTIPNAKGVFLRGVGEDPLYDSIKITLINWYQNLGARIVNDKSYIKYPSLDKTMQYIKMAQSNIPIVESFYFGSRKGITTWASKNYPFIAKDSVGSCGTEVYKIDSDEKAIELMELKYKDKSIKTLLFQRFLKTEA